VERIPTYIIKLLPYLSVTFEYVFASLVIGGILGFFLAAAKLGKHKILKRLAVGYTTVMRCTPSIVLLFMIFYGLPLLLKSTFDIDIQNVDTIVFVIITFSLFLGGSLSEVMRSAYESVDRGQFEAAVSIGLSGVQAFCRIILPQAFAVSLPNIGNTILFLIKEGALGYIIGLIDIMGKAYLINGFEMQAHVLQVYLALSFIYWPLSIIIEQLFKYLEKKFTFDQIKEESQKALGR
jgi:L-cystine transport system permease protein